MSCYTSTFTVWKAGAPNDYGAISYGLPVVFRGLFKVGDNIKMTDSKGQEFYPSSTFWSRLEVISGAAITPREGDLIVMGSHGDTDPSQIDNAQQVRGVTIFDNSMFGEPSDYVFGTK